MVNTNFFLSLQSAVGVEVSVRIFASDQQACEQIVETFEALQEDPDDFCLEVCGLLYFYRTLASCLLMVF